MAEPSAGVAASVPSTVSVGVSVASPPGSASPASVPPSGSVVASSEGSSGWPSFSAGCSSATPAAGSSGASAASSVSVTSSSAISCGSYAASAKATAGHMPVTSVSDKTVDSTAGAGFSMGGPSLRRWCLARVSRLGAFASHFTSQTGRADSLRGVFSPGEVKTGWTVGFRACACCS